MRLQAISKYLGSRSMPVNVRPSWIAATPVVPLPMNGSRMVCGLPACSMHHFIRARGFWVGCSFPSRNAVAREYEKMRAARFWLLHANSQSARENSRCPLSQTSHCIVGGR